MASMKEAMREGLISPAAASKFVPKGIRNTRTIPSKMTHFDNKEKNEGDVRAKGHLATRKEIDQRELQDTPAQFKPTADKGRSATARPAARTSSPKGGRVLAHDTPKVDHLDSFPKKQKEKFPAGTDYGGRGYSNRTGNTRMKGRQPIKSGGPEGHNAREPRYYGGPNGRDSDGTHYGK
jgi:hypothetical protein